MAVAGRSPVIFADMDVGQDGRNATDGFGKQFFFHVGVVRVEHRPDAGVVGPAHQFCELRHGVAEITLKAVQGFGSQDDVGLLRVVANDMQHLGTAGIFVGLRFPARKRGEGRMKRPANHRCAHCVGAVNYAFEVAHGLLPDGG